MKESDRAILTAQIWLSVLVLGSLLVLALCYELGYASRLSLEQDRQISRIINWLEAAALIVISYWFQRQRGFSPLDDSQMITTSHTLPDGTRTVTTAPIAHPPVGGNLHVESQNIPVKIEPAAVIPGPARAADAGGARAP